MAAPTTVEQHEQQRWYQRIRNLEARVTGNSSTLTSVVTTVSTLPGADTLAPAAPTLITLTSSTYLSPSGQTFAKADIAWTAVTTNSDGTACTDLDGYLVSWRLHTDTYFGPEQYVAAPTTELIVLGFTLGQVLDIQVRARDTSGNKGSWAQLLNVALTTDTTPPNQPSTPTVTGVLAGIRVVWDGKDYLGAAMPPDFGHYEVHQSTTSGFTPSASTLVDSLPTAGGASTIPLNDYGTTHYVKIVAYDLSLNASTPSAQGSASPTQAVDADLLTATITNRVMGANSVATANIQNAAITTALIGNLQVVTAAIASLAVTDAKIGDCSITKLTAGTLSADLTVSARIKTANSGQRVELNSTGLQCYNSFGTLTVDISSGQATINAGSITGLTITGGTIQTATSGNRVALSGSSNQLEIYSSSSGLIGTLSVSGAGGAGPTTVGLVAGGSAYLNIDPNGGGIGGTNVFVFSSPIEINNGVESTILPSFDNTYNLGNTSFRWANINTVGLGTTGSVTMSSIPVGTIGSTAGWANSGTTTLLRSSSSKRYKVNIEYDDQPDYTILNLKSLKYEDKAEDLRGRRYHGFIAEDVVKTHPDLVVYDEDGTTPGGLFYDRVPVLLIPVVRDMNERLARLEGKRSA